MQVAHFYSVLNRPDPGIATIPQQENLGIAIDESSKAKKRHFAKSQAKLLHMKIIKADIDIAKHVCLLNH